MLALAGCAQPAMAPSINAATAHVLDALGISLVEAPGAGCCGAVRQHLGDSAGGRADAKRNIDAWWPLIERDVSEVLSAELDQLKDAMPAGPAPDPLAFHAPCTLQHGLRLKGHVEALLGAVGYALTPVADAHLCCSSAGTYSLLQPTLSKTLRDNKLQALQAGGANCIASANIGCITHLQSGTATPARHWIELIDARLHGA